MTFEVNGAVNLKTGVLEPVEGRTGTMFLQNSLTVNQTARRHPVKECETLCGLLGPGS